MTYNLYWGDLHSHCSISYGHGSSPQALARARQQLDFCSVTGHAFWPDMPTDRTVYADIIDYHHAGFARMARNWNKLLAYGKELTQEGRFLVLPSYEWHSCKYGDHNIYARGPELPLRDAPDLPALREIIRPAGGIAIPHHIGYRAGYRGIDWEHFREDLTPFVEIFSLHGCSIGEYAPYPMLHDMGPRDWGSTAEAGWARGHRFGIIASTDHHAGYPGSHGDGRIAVYAKSLTREALFEAFLARRVYAATGDRIEARCSVNDAWIGEGIRAPGRRSIRYQVQGSDALSQVELLKNGALLHRAEITDGVQAAKGLGETETARFRLRLSWGWGRRKEVVRWVGELGLSEGEIRAVESCFTGHAVVAPKGGETVKGDEEIPDEEDLPHEIQERQIRRIRWRSVSSGNLSMRHGTTQGLSLELEAPLRAHLTVAVNGQKLDFALGELLNKGRSHFLRGWLSEAIRVGPLVPLAACRAAGEIADLPEQEVDYYHLRVAQHNGQWAWLSPIWVER